ncbi:hypothetical protein [Cellulosimicrobium cellulans]|jgi:hypothetical protein|uniref:Peptidase S9 n=1 Tax=Cellulosimicrobium cellulans TaxID=1710 RepID=A0A4Y4E834_CELCE|nr:hypothetical protein [Cellulosimicrobium cellulans]GED10791.1 hypothetical protein CCE02nite_27900 [Cellulosimicrobium cellulans]
MTEHAPTRRVADPRTVAIAGLSTVAWYAVPDVVRPRWARALAKTAIGTAAVVLTFTSTTEGTEAREGVRSLRDAAREAGAAVADATPGPTTTDGAPREDNTWATTDDGTAPVPAGVAVAGTAAGLALATTLVVAGEKWVYRRGERLRDRGVRLPHTRVGLVVGALAVALAAAEPLLWNAEER